jgi:hypothetical protein
MFDTIRCAKKSITGGGTATFWASAFARRIAMRVSRSGAEMSAVRPHSKRERSLSSSCVIAFGGRSLEKLFLRALFSGDELDVVDEEHVDAPVALAELLALLRANRVDEFVREFFARRVRDAFLGMTRDHRVTDRVHQVRLPESRPSVNEERVVAVARTLGHGEGRGVGEAVIRPHNEGREGVARVEERTGLTAVLPACLLAVPAGRRGGHARGRARPRGCRRRAGGGHKTHVDGAAEKVLKRGTDLWSEFALEPLARECVRHTDEENVVLFGEDLRVLEPGVVLRARKSDLELAKGGRPKLFEVQRLPFSSLVQQTLPTTITRSPPAPHRRERPKFRPPVSEARELYPKEKSPRLLLC